MEQRSGLISRMAGLSFSTPRWNGEIIAKKVVNLKIIFKMFNLLYTFSPLS